MSGSPRSSPPGPAFWETFDGTKVESTNQIKSNQIKSINGSSQWIKSNQTFWSETFATYFFRISSDPILNPMYIDPCIQQSWQSYTILMYINNISNSWTHWHRFLRSFQRTDEATMPRHIVSLKFAKMNIASLRLRYVFGLNFQRNPGACQNLGIQSR